jgi:hypothetical protein
VEQLSTSLSFSFSFPYLILPLIPLGRPSQISQHRVDHPSQESIHLHDPRKPHLAVCVWICDPETSRWRIQWHQRAERPPPLRGTPLHYAALWGLHSIVEFLVIDHSQDVHSRDFTDNATSLDLATKHGHVKAACMLIEHGADMNAQNKDGESLLHRALIRGRVEIACMLIERGADVTARMTAPTKGRSNSITSGVASGTS